MDKFIRNYALAVTLSEGDLIIIKPPFTVEFEIVRNDFSSANYSSIRIYNLGEKTRSQIRVDSWDIASFKKVLFQAGYLNPSNLSPVIAQTKSNLPVIFSGIIQRAWSVREGVNFITQMENYDGGEAFQLARTNTQFTSKTPNDTVINNLVDSLKSNGVTKGAVGNNFGGTTSRGKSYTGNTCDLLSDLTNGGFFIDNQKAYCLTDDEALDVGDLLVINSQTGLLGTPVREQSRVHLDMIFEPRIQIGQQVKVESQTEKNNFNGFYRVVAVHHKGMISEAVCGDAITTLTLLPGTFSLIKPEVA